MFKRADEARLTVRLSVNGKQVSAAPGDTVAAALVAAGISPFRRTPVNDAPRSVYCMMGVCFDCLVTIDGVANRQACLVPVSDGLKIETGHGKRNPDTEGR